MRIFVTGASGFVGSNFVNQSLNNGHEVFALIREGSKSRVRLTNEPSWVIGGLEGDYTDIMEKCDVFVHLAAYGVSPQRATWDKCVDINILQSLRICQQAIESGIKKIIVAGTSAEYGSEESCNLRPIINRPLKPTGPYASSKAALFQLLCGLSSEYDFSLSYLRLFTLYGEGQYEKNLWPSLRIAAVRGDDFVIHNGTLVRDFISVTDAINKMLAIIDCSTSEGGVEVYDISSGKLMTVFEFSKHWWGEFGATGNLIASDC